MDMGKFCDCIKEKFQCSAWLVSEVIITAPTSGVRYSQRASFLLARQVMNE